MFSCLQILRCKSKLFKKNSENNCWEKNLINDGKKELPEKLFSFGDKYYLQVY